MASIVKGGLIGGGWIASRGSEFEDCLVIGIELDTGFQMFEVTGAVELLVDGCVLVEGLGYFSGAGL